MSLTGQVSFYEKSKSLLADGASVVVSTGNNVKDYILGTNKYLKWESVGSNDTITETIEITLPYAQSINRIFLLDHNFKEYTIKYDVASVWTDFTNVIGLDGILVGGISETIYNKDTSYYEFDSVTTTKILISALKTQTINQEKSLATCFITTEIGTLIGYPEISNDFDRNARIEKTLSGKYSIVKSYDTLGQIDIRFEFNPFQNDQSIIETLYDSNEPFLVWLCGGKYGSDDLQNCPVTSEWFRIAQKGWDLKEIYQVQTDGKLDTNFYKNVYKAGTVFRIRLREAVN